jgi:asparagine synthetase B (glutamine-hydrolysing)
MCGFVVADSEMSSVSDATRFVRRRGPDLWSTIWYRRFTFQHALLSMSHEFRLQPFLSKDGSLVCVFNGEIYNASTFGATASDGDCIISLCQQHGFDFPRLLEGEFAIVLADFREGVILTCSDTFGTKPLWVSSTGEHLAFASHASSIRNIGTIEPEEHSPNSICIWDIQTRRMIRKARVTTFNLEQYKAVTTSG